MNAAAMAKEKLADTQSAAATEIMTQVRIGEPSGASTPRAWYCAASTTIHKRNADAMP